jgi:hypothetical protein
MNRNRPLLSRTALYWLIFLSQMACSSGPAAASSLGVRFVNSAGCFGLTAGTASPCLGALTIQVQNRPSGWKLVRAPESEKPGAKSGGIAIMKTADTMRSDPDFAGLMVRCADKGKIDVLVVLVSPFPPRSRPKVTIGAGPGAQVFEGQMAAAGAAVVLPEAVAALAGGPWQSTASLAIAVKDNDSEIKGIVALDGLRPAYGNLLASCMQ